MLCICARHNSVLGRTVCCTIACDASKYRCARLPAVNAASTAVSSAVDMHAVADQHAGAVGFAAVPRQHRSGRFRDVECVPAQTVADREGAAGEPGRNRMGVAGKGNQRLRAGHPRNRDGGRERRGSGVSVSASASAPTVVRPPPRWRVRLSPTRAQNASRDACACATLALPGTVRHQGCAAP